MRPEIFTINIINHATPIEPADPVKCAWKAPAQGRENKATLAYDGKNPRAFEFRYSGCAVVCCSGLLVELVGGFKDKDGDSVFGKEHGEEEARGAGAYDDDLLQIWNVSLLAL